jgi:hypothetical protein
VNRLKEPRGARLADNCELVYAKNLRSIRWCKINSISDRHRESPAGAKSYMIMLVWAVEVEEFSVKTFFLSIRF